jgi:hypothetical protein
MRKREERKPWERLPNEGKVPFAYFEYFRKLGPKRQIPPLVQHFKKSDSTFYKYSMRFNWLERAQLWDIQVQETFDGAIIADAESAAKKQLEAWSMLLELGTISAERLLDRAKRLLTCRSCGQEVLERADQCPICGGELVALSPATVRETTALLREATAAQRLILGEATARTETLDLSKMSREERDVIRKALLKAKRY